MAPLRRGGWRPKHSRRSVYWMTRSARAPSRSTPLRTTTVYATTRPHRPSRRVDADEAAGRANRPRRVPPVRPKTRCRSQATASTAVSEPSREHLRLPSVLSPSGDGPRPAPPSCCDEQPREPADGGGRPAAERWRRRSSDRAERPSAMSIRLATLPTLRGGWLRLRLRPGSSPSRSNTSARCTATERACRVPRRC